MSRPPLTYALGRPLDGDAGGSADLQTDIMRFMAIIALCLMAIFALVQSLPEPGQLTSASPDEPPAETSEAEVELAPIEPEPLVLSRPVREPAPPPEPVALTRPKPVPAPRPTAAPASKPPPPVTAKPEPEGFTLRFESDRALTRLVATGQVGLFALSDGRAQRMSVASSQVSFWSAPTPASFHEMDPATVPGAVRDALVRTGDASSGTRWAVTLPARLTKELNRITREHTGGALIIAMDGTLSREAS